MMTPYEELIAERAAVQARLQRRVDAARGVPRFPQPTRLFWKLVGAGFVWGFVVGAAAVTLTSFARHVN